MDGPNKRPKILLPAARLHRTAPWRFPVPAGRTRRQTTASRSSGFNAGPAAHSEQGPADWPFPDACDGRQSGTTRLGGLSCQGCFAGRIPRDDSLLPLPPALGETGSSPPHTASLPQCRRRHPGQHVQKQTPVRTSPPFVPQRIQGGPGQYRKPRTGRRVAGNGSRSESPGRPRSGRRLRAGTGREPPRQSDCFFPGANSRITLNMAPTPSWMPTPRKASSRAR